MQKEFNIDKWSPDLLGPIIKSTLTAKEVCDLKNKKFTQQITALDLGGFSTTEPEFVPVIDTPSKTKPFKIQLSDYFSYVKVDTSVTPDHLNK
ncbi:MAG: hypothetical protein IPP77_05390 [Bacteroidetes bacterium]|nr:hypothetical protein [Bacteroidota bacterium]